MNRLALWSVALLLASQSNAWAQRPLCSQLAEAERARARAAGICRDPAPIIDVPPKATEPEPAAAPALIAVPHVVGLNFDEARNRLTRFTLQRAYRPAAEPGGTVLAQSPASPATLPAGASVSLVLSDGSLVRVPRVTSININDARQRLQEADIRPQPVVVTSDQRIGTVIEQQPAEGAVVRRGSVVRLQVSAGQEGPELLSVPNVIGMSFDRARTQLTRFTVERTDRARSEQNQAPEGQVIEQTPRASTRAAAGSVIMLTVSSPPRPLIEVFEMPNVIGRSMAEATRALVEFQVTSTDSDSASPRGQVLAQTPAAGAALRAGDAVSLQVSSGKSAAAPNGASASPADESDAGSWRAVLAIGGGVLLGLIVGALVMRQWLRHRQAAATADGVIASLSPVDSSVRKTAPLSNVDILLDDGVPEFASERPPHSAPLKEGTDRESAEAEATEAAQQPIEARRDADKSS